MHERLLAFTLAAGVTVLLTGCGTPPQMGSDEEVFRTVDALYTAVTARNEKLVDQCDQRLSKLKQAGKLPESAANYLDDVIATARAGQWRPAAERLHAFMKSQRRDT
ncbi:MAG: hypothetical protein HY289_05830 [Planctomycetes bacterium]|nr:hypothetical protein [Planctomycetota bacterium]